MIDNKILIIDDEITVSTMVKFALEDGYDVATTTSSLTALKYLSVNKVDLILLDINMPQLNGLITLEEIKRICPEVIVVMMTGHDSDEYKKTSRVLGAYGYITKPFDVDELRAYIDNVLLQKEGNELRV